VVAYERAGVSVLPLLLDFKTGVVQPESCLMIVRTVEQVRRALRIVVGFTLLLVGIVMIVTPGPGWLVIFFGLGLLAAEFVWARRLMERMKREGDRVREAVMRAAKSVSPESSPESNETE
jgi:uncharacterized protein (TIGR02611 family)